MHSHEAFFIAGQPVPGTPGNQAAFALTISIDFDGD
jgi:hypothetical protein